MAASPIEVSRLAERIWLKVSTGSPNSMPSQREVELDVQNTLAYWAKREMYDKYKLENQWVNNSGYIIPFYGLELVAHDGDSFTKKFELPVKPIDIPKDRGLVKVTWFETRGTAKTEKEMGRLTVLNRLDPTGFYRTMKSDYFATWIGSDVLVNGKCNDKQPEIDKANAYILQPNTANVDQALEYIVTSEVMKLYRGYSPKDEAADQNQKP